MKRLLFFWCVCSFSASTLAGCSYHAYPVSATNETIRVSEVGQGKNCTATIAVKETADGKTNSSRQAGVPCGSVAAVKSQMIGAAKQGL